MSAIRFVRADLQKSIQRFEKVTLARLQRIREALAKQQQIFLDVLPLLFHVNHPLLPGFVSNATPFGVSHYTPSDFELKQLRNFTIGFDYRKEKQRGDDIHSIFLMGSPGSLGYTRHSDLDFWICHSGAISPQGLAELQQKCQRIEKWAREIHLEVHFFLMNPTAFRRGERDVLHGDDCGSTQHLLLLDEFYRTGILVSGRPPAWWLVPPDQEDNYDIAVSHMLEHRLILPNQIVDFGNVGKVPLEEFVGAGVWQLYKAIHSPYKSVLKLLLSEVYATHENLELLSTTYKKAIYSGCDQINDLDPYVMIYRRIEAYLNEINDRERLDFVRRCFYAKAGVKLSKYTSTNRMNWQTQLINKLWRHWGWPERVLVELDSRHTWKAPRVEFEHQLLVGELFKSYELIRRLIEDRAIASQVTAEELAFLGNNLTAAFEDSANKIPRLNPSISHDMSENSVELAFEKNTEQHWHLLSEQSAIALRSSPRLLDILCWTAINGIITNATRIKITGDVAINHAQLNNLQRLTRNFVILDEAEDQVFYDNDRIDAVLVLLDCGMIKSKNDNPKLAADLDPIKVDARLTSNDTRIELVYRNSWGEYFCEDFHGNHAVLDSLSFISQLCHDKGNANAPELIINSSQGGVDASIENRYRDLFDIMIETFGLQNIANSAKLVVELVKTYHLITHTYDGVERRSFSDRRQLLNHLGLSGGGSYSSIVLDKNSLRDSDLPAILEISRPGRVQVIFKHRNKLATVYINDEHGAFFNFYAQYHSPQALLEPLVRFFRNIRIQQYGEAANDQANMPFFYELHQNHTRRKADIEPLYLDLTQRDNEHFEVQAIAHRDANGELQFDLSSNNLTFSYIEYGDQLYQRVAEAILSQRRHKERYPCYLTSLSLENCGFPQGQNGIQTIHYLKQKQAIEFKLNQALREL